LAGVEEKQKRITKKNKKDKKKTKNICRFQTNCVRVDRFLKETSKTKNPHWGSMPQWVETVVASSSRRQSLVSFDGTLLGGN